MVYTTTMPEHQFNSMGRILLAKKITPKLFMKRSDKLAKKFDEISEKRIDVEKLL